MHVIAKKIEQKVRKPGNVSKKAIWELPRWQKSAESALFSSGWSENALAFLFHLKHSKSCRRAKKVDLDAKLNALSENQGPRSLRAILSELWPIFGRKLKIVGQKIDFRAIFGPFSHSKIATVANGYSPVYTGLLTKKKKNWMNFSH